MGYIKSAIEDCKTGGLEILCPPSVPADSRRLTIKGEYFDRINGGEWMRTGNLITNEGVKYILNTAFGSNQKAGQFYIALFQGEASPTADWTADRFSSVANELTSSTEGYADSTRPLWIPTDTTTTVINNINSAARLTMKTSSELSVTGVALLTNNEKGGTSGTLISATKYLSPRTFRDGDIYEIGYSITLTAQ